MQNFASPMYGQLVDLYVKVHGERPTEASLQEFASSALGHRVRPAQLLGGGFDKGIMKGQNRPTLRGSQSDTKVKFNEAAVVDTFRKIHSRQPTRSELLAFTAEIGIQSQITWCWEEQDNIRKQSEYESLRTAACSEVDHGRLMRSPLRTDSEPRIASAPAALEMGRDSAVRPYRPTAGSRTALNSPLNVSPQITPSNSPPSSTAGSANAGQQSGSASARAAQQRLAATRARLLALSRARQAVQKQARALSEDAERLCQSVARRSAALGQEHTAPASPARWRPAQPGRIPQLVPLAEPWMRGSAGRAGGDSEYPVWHGGRATQSDPGADTDLSAAGTKPDASSDFAAAARIGPASAAVRVLRHAGAAPDPFVPSPPSDSKVPSREHEVPLLPDTVPVLRFRV